jgi:hypothetical protein
LTTRQTGPRECSKTPGAGSRGNTRCSRTQRLWTRSLTAGPSKVQIFLGCVLAPQIFRPPTHRCGWRYLIGGFRKMQQVGLWKLKNVSPLAVGHQ